MARITFDPDELVGALVLALQHPDVVRILGIVEAPAPEKARMTAEEFAQRLKVSVRTVRKWSHEGLPCVKLGRLVRIDVASADSWLAQGGRQAAIEARARRDAERVLAREGMANGKAS